MDGRVQASGTRLEVQSFSPDQICESEYPKDHLGTKNVPVQKSSPEAAQHSLISPFLETRDNRKMIGGQISPLQVAESGEAVANSKANRFEPRVSDKPVSVVMEMW